MPLQQNMALPSSGLKNKAHKKPAWSRRQAKQVPFACSLLHAGFLLGLLVNPVGGCKMFLWNVSWLSADDMAYRENGV
jgi:hypothetical protein